MSNPILTEFLSVGGSFCPSAVPHEARHMTPNRAEQNARALSTIDFHLLRILVCHFAYVWINDTTH